jgi:outer membrane receptor protein involved in Fe transport
MREVFSRLVLGLSMAFFLTQMALAHPLIGSGARRVSFDSPLPVATVTPDLFERLPDVSTLPVINVPGGRQVGLEPGTARVTLRGLGNRQPLILENARRIGDTGFGFGNAQIPDPRVDGLPGLQEAVEVIDVCRDGSGAVFGSDAVAGVVSFIATDKQKRGALATESAGSIVNPALQLSYDLSGTGYSATTDFCLNSGRILP